MRAASLVDPDGPVPDSWFLGLAVPVAVRRDLVGRLGTLRESWSSVAWTRPSGWHVTVTWLGGLDPGRPKEVVERVTAAVAGSPPGRGRLSLGPPRWFGRALAVTAVTDHLLVGLHERVAEAMAEPGEAGGADAMDPGPWRPHVTLARRRRTSVGGLADAVATRLDGEAIAWAPRELTLYGSRSGTGAARYVAESRIPLGRDAGA